MTGPRRAIANVPYRLLTRHCRPAHSRWHCSFVATNISGGLAPIPAFAGTQDNGRDAPTATVRATRPEQIEISNHHLNGGRLSRPAAARFWF